jgi:hypothetical protein
MHLIYSKNEFSYRATTPIITNSLEESQYGICKVVVYGICKVVVLLTMLLLSSGYFTTVLHTVSYSVIQHTVPPAESF